MPSRQGDEEPTPDANDRRVGNGILLRMGNREFQARGVYVVVILCLFLIGLATIYANFKIAAVNLEGFQALSKRLDDIAELTRQQDKAFMALSKEHQSLLEGIDAMVYVLTRSPEERAKLQWERPRYLRRLQQKEKE